MFYVFTWRLIILTTSNKAKKTTSTLKRLSRDVDAIEISSEEESDGNSALRKVEEDRTYIGGKRGPRTSTLDHWHEPVKTRQPSGLRWLFKCRYCNMYAIILSYLLLFTYLAKIESARYQQLRQRKHFRMNPLVHLLGI